MRGRIVAPVVLAVLLLLPSVQAAFIDDLSTNPFTSPARWLNDGTGCTTYVSPLVHLGDIGNFGCSGFFIWMRRNPTMGDYTPQTQADSFQMSFVVSSIDKFDATQGGPGLFYFGFVNGTNPEGTDEMAVAEIRFDYTNNCIAVRPVFRYSDVTTTFGTTTPCSIQRAHKFSGFVSFDSSTQQLTAHLSDDLGNTVESSATMTSGKRFYLGNVLLFNENGYLQQALIGNGNIAVSDNIAPQPTTGPPGGVGTKPPPETQPFLPFVLPLFVVTILQGVCSLWGLVFLALVIATYIAIRRARKRMPDLNP